MCDFSDFLSDKFYNMWTQQRRSVSPCKLLEQYFESFTIRNRFSKKSAEIAHKISRSCDLSHHNYTMITDHRKFTITWTPQWDVCFHFYRQNQFNVFLLSCTLRTRNVLHTFWAMSDVWYWVNHVRICSCLAVNMEEKQTKLEMENK